MSTRITDSLLLARYPGVGIDRDTQRFWMGCLQRRLLIDQCSNCGRWSFPCLPMCSSCWSTELTATQVSGRGEIALLMVMRQGPPYPGANYDEAPYRLAAVELQEQAGLRITAPVLGPEPAEPAIGQRVSLTWVGEADAPFPAFRVVRDRSS
jgi:uncharacterized protein